MRVFRALWVFSVLTIQVFGPSMSTQDTPGGDPAAQDEDVLTSASSVTRGHDVDVHEVGSEADGGELGYRNHRSNTSVIEGDDDMPGLGGDDVSGSDKVMDIHIDTTTPGLSLPVPAGVLVMFMDSQRVFSANYTLRCPVRRGWYVLTASLRQLFHQKTAALTSPVKVNISCERGDVIQTDDDTESGDVEDGGVFVSGTFDISISSELLGKGVLLFFLSGVNGGNGSDGAKPWADHQEFSLPSHISSNAMAKAEASHDSDSITTASSPSSSSSILSSTFSSSSSSSSPSSPALVHQAVLLVLRPYRVIDVIFRITTYVVIVAATVAMGCSTDLKVVKEVLRKPSAPVIGFFCQYLCMPLIAYGVARWVDVGNSLVSFGIFACGVCPGGGVSNMYTHLLGGDLTLSVTLTIISTIASLGMIPLWLFTLGGTLESGSGLVRIPFLKILETLAKIILPLFLGLFLQFRLPRVAKVILKVMKPVFVVAILFFLSIGIYANFYIFRLFDPLTILAGCMLPYIGYVVGGVVSFVCRQPWPRVKTIALETGIQNVGVAFLILIFSLPPPEGELSAVGPAASAIMTSLPPLFVSILYSLYNKRQKARAKVSGSGTKLEPSGQKSEKELPLQPRQEEGVEEEEEEGGKEGRKEEEQKMRMLK